MSVSRSTWAGAPERSDELEQRLWGYAAAGASPAEEGPAGAPLDEEGLEDDPGLELAPALDGLDRLAAGGSALRELYERLPHYEHARARGSDLGADLWARFPSALLKARHGSLELLALGARGLLEWRRKREATPRA